MSVRTRLGYITRGFRGGENITEKVYLTQQVALDFQNIEVDLEVLESPIISVDIVPYNEITAEVSLIAAEIFADISIDTQEVTVEVVSASAEAEVLNLEVSL